MTSPSAPKEKFFERVINPYLAEVLQQLQTIEMREGVLHIREIGVDNPLEKIVLREGHQPLPRGGATTPSNH